MVKGIHFPLEGGVIAKESNKVRRRGEGLLSPGVGGTLALKVHVQITGVADGSDHGSPAPLRPPQMKHMQQQGNGSIETYRRSPYHYCNCRIFSLPAAASIRTTRQPARK